MTIRVFHPPGAWLPGGELTIADEELHYLHHVRRARAGASVEILDGAGAIARAIVVAIGSRGATLRIEEVATRRDDDAPILWLGVPDATATLAAITAACELGCQQIHLVRCARSPSDLPGPARVERVVRAALRQCGLPRAPEIAGPTTLADRLASAPHARGLFAWERLAAASSREPEDVDARVSPTDPARDGSPTDPAVLLVGPEGGFTDEEAAAVLAAGLQPVSLGPWTLRTPTAVAAGLALLRARQQRAPRERAREATRGPTGAGAPSRGS